MYLFRGLDKLDQNPTAKCIENAFCFPSVFKNTFLLFLVVIMFTVSLILCPIVH